MAKVVVGCLVYLNDNVFDRRIDMCRQSFASFNTFENQMDDVEILFVNNGNDPRVAQELKNHVKVPYKLLNLGQNFYDISVHMCSYWRARDTHVPHFVYTYDDFVFYKNDWVKPTIEFMDENTLPCIRLPKYELNKRDEYDTAKTPKSVNPESVRHESGAGNLPLSLSFPKTYSTYQFYRLNWRPNSRPMMWKTVEFASVVVNSYIDGLKVMQPFEAAMYAYADKKATTSDSWNSGFVDGGVCKTFPVDTSERTQDPNHYRDVLIDTKELEKAYKKALIDAS